MVDERWLTVEEVAEIAKVHEQTVRRWLRAGTLRGHLISRRAGYRIRQSDLTAFLTGENGGELAEGKLAA
jgi:excisionase family DNA binding protein